MPRYSGASPSPSGTSSSRENPPSGASTVRSVTFRSAAEILESQDAREAAAKGQPDSQEWAANVDWSQQERDAREQLARQQRAAALPPPSPGPRRPRAVAISSLSRAVVAPSSAAVSSH